MRVHLHKHSIRSCAQMQQFDACAGPAQPTEQAQPLNPTPRAHELDVDLSLAAAVTNLRILRADRQIEG